MKATINDFSQDRQRQNRRSPMLLMCIIKLVPVQGRSTNVVLKFSIPSGTALQ